MTRIEEKKYAVDQNKLKEYFPLSVVIECTVNVYIFFQSMKYMWHRLCICTDSSDPSVPLITLC